MQNLAPVCLYFWGQKGFSLQIKEQLQQRRKKHQNRSLSDLGGRFSTEMKRQTRTECVCVCVCVCGGGVIFSSKINFKTIIIMTIIIIIESKHQPQEPTGAARER